MAPDVLSATDGAQRRDKKNNKSAHEGSVQVGNLQREADEAQGPCPFGMNSEGFYSGMHVAEERKRRRHERATQHRAVVRIQALVRGFRTRKAASVISGSAMERREEVEETEEFIESMAVVQGGDSGDFTEIIVEDESPELGNIAEHREAITEQQRCDENPEEIKDEAEAATTSTVLQDMTPQEVSTWLAENNLAVCVEPLVGSRDHY